MPARELEQITARGRLLARYDVMAWIGTDSLQATRPPPKPGGRYLARPVGDRWEFVYGRLAPSRTSFLIEYRAEAELPGGAVIGARTAASDTGYYARAGRALDLAMHDFESPRRPYNVAVIPDSDSWLVYFYPAQTDPAVWPLGGDIRVRIDAVGSRVLEKRRMHRAILDESFPGDAPPAFSVHSAYVDDRPEDTDVLAVLRRAARVPEYVITATFIFRINLDGSISPFERFSQ